MVIHTKCVAELATFVRTVDFNRKLKLEDKMSNAVLNAHIQMGEPCGEDADLFQIADWAGELILSGNGALTDAQLSMLRDIGEYLHTEEKNDDARRYALERYFQLYDSVTGR